MLENKFKTLPKRFCRTRPGPPRSTSQHDPEKTFTDRETDHYQGAWEVPGPALPLTEQAPKSGPKTLPLRRYQVQSLRVRGRSDGRSSQSPAVFGGCLTLCLTRQLGPGSIQICLYAS